MADFTDNDIAGMVELHKEFYPTASASTRSQILKQWKRRGYGPSSIAYSVEKMYLMKKRLDEREIKLDEREIDMEDYWAERNAEVEHERDEVTKERRWNCRQEDILKKNQKNSEATKHTAEELREIQVKVRRKCVTDWISMREWMDWIHEEFTDKQIAQFGL